MNPIRIYPYLKEKKFGLVSKQKGENNQFSQYTKNKVVVKDVSKMLDAIKQKMDKEGGKV